MCGSKAFAHFDEVRILIVSGGIPHYARDQYPDDNPTVEVGIRVWL